VVLSIKAGTVSSALLLRRLGTYSRRNRLYQAFSELGRVYSDRVPPGVSEQRGCTRICHAPPRCCLWTLAASCLGRANSRVSGGALIDVSACTAILQMALRGPRSRCCHRSRYGSLIHADVTPAVGSVRLTVPTCPTLVDGLARVASRAGARLLTGTRVEAIEQDGRRVSGVGVSAQGSRGHVFVPAAVVLATTPSGAAKLLSGTAFEPLRPDIEAFVPAEVACLDVALQRFAMPAGLGRCTTSSNRAFSQLSRNCPGRTADGGCRRQISNINDEPSVRCRSGGLPFV